MDRMLYVAMNGAGQALTAQAAQAHNLANASTTGFRADLMDFRALPVYGPGYPSRVYALAERPAVDLRPGTILHTGRELDVAVQGEGYLAVLARDGTEAYTRAGDLRVGAGGRLETGSGLAVLGNAGPIALPPADKIEIAPDGTVSLRPRGQDAASLAVVDRIKLVRPEPGTLVKGADGLLRTREPGAVLPADARVKLAPGAIESSNVNAVEAMIQMISLARQFETQVKLMQTARDTDRAASEMMRIG